MIIQYCYTALLCLTAIAASLCIPSVQLTYPHTLHRRSLRSVPSIESIRQTQWLAATGTIPPALSSLSKESEAQFDDNVLLVRRSTGDEESSKGNEENARGPNADADSVEYTPEQVAMYKQRWRDVRKAYEKVRSDRTKAKKEGRRLTPEDDENWATVKEARRREDTVWNRVRVGKPIDRKVYKEYKKRPPPLIQRIISGETTIEQEELLVEPPVSSKLADEDIALYDRLLNAAERVQEARFAKNTAAKEGRTFTSEDEKALQQAEADLQKLSRGWDAVRQAKGLGAFNPHGVGRSGAGYSDAELSQVLTPEEAKLFKALRKANRRYRNFLYDNVNIPVDAKGITEDSDRYGLTKAGETAYHWLWRKVKRGLDAKKTSSHQRMEGAQSKDAQASPEIKTTEAQTGRITLEELRPVFSPEELAAYEHAQEARKGLWIHQQAKAKAEKEGRKQTREEIEAYEKVNAAKNTIRSLRAAGISRLIERGMARPEIAAREKSNRERANARKKSYQANKRKSRQAQEGIREEIEGIDEESSQGQQSEGTRTSPSGKASPGTITSPKNAEDNLKDKPLQSSSIPSQLLSKFDHFVNSFRNQRHGTFWNRYRQALPELRTPSPMLVPPKWIP